MNQSGTKLKSFILKLLLNLAIVSGFCNFSFHQCLASKNKESYHLIEENFSQSDEIDLKGLYRHIHYEFQDETLLKAALHPLLPVNLQNSQLKHQHLEFLGDAVLGLIIRERILELFPDQPRALHNDLYVLLTQNKTLAEVYKNNLKIEAYLPYPGVKTCEYCNVIESLIGAIFSDNQQNGLLNSRKFVLRILDNAMLEEMWHEVLKSRKSHPKKLKSQTLLSDEIPSSPKLAKIINDLVQAGELDTGNPKSFLNTALTQFCNDMPEYTSPFIGVDEGDRPVFTVHVIGAGIGRIQGAGYTVDEAEQEAAKAALNFLAQREIIASTPLCSQSQTYTKFINEYCHAKKLSLPSIEKVITPLSFVAKVQVENQIFEATGPSKKKAEEQAAQNAYQYLTGIGKAEPQFLDGSKQYRSVLREWFDQKKIKELRFEKATHSLPLYNFIVKVNTNFIGKGSSPLKKEAREKAYRMVFEKLLKAQERGLSYQEDLKSLAQYTKSIEVIIARLNEDKEAELKKEESFPSQPVVHQGSTSSPKKPLLPSISNRSKKKLQKNLKKANNNQ
ncbi:MAG: hypothetical protein IBJ00_00165 [Alphaproteobacteria bacterium]|nr:hypothetical protein [Alphaproteobacteria bacterium]